MSQHQDDVQSATTSNEIRIEVGNLRARTETLEAKIAESKPVQELMKLLLYFWAAISVVLGLFGWKQFSDIESMVSKQVQLQLPKDKASFAEYSRLIDETHGLYGEFEKLTATYKERVKDLDFASTVSDDFDIEGKVKAILDESDVEGNADDPAWRTKAIYTIMRFQEKLKSKSFDSDLIFNVAQVCRQLLQRELVTEMTAAALTADPSPPVRAMYLASSVASSTGTTRDKSFKELMGMVESLSSNSPHIVLAEAWNAAEDQRRYTEFQTSLRRLIEARGKFRDAERYVPSYTYFIFAQTYLRQGNPGSMEQAKDLLKQGTDRFASESVESLWFNASAVQLVNLNQIIRKSESIQGKLIDTDFDSANELGSAGAISRSVLE